MSVLPVSVVVTTYDRGDNSRFPLLYQTIVGLLKHLKYPNLHWIITDDGSPNHAEMVENVKDILGEREVTFFNTQRRGVGYAKNNALREAFKLSHIVLLTEDDWLLTEPLDLLPHVQLMLDHDDIGMIRYGFLGGEMTAIYTDYGYPLTFWSLQRDSGLYVYSGQISLRSSKVYSTVGWHKEGGEAGDEELDFCHRWNNTEHNLKVLWPAQYGTTLNAGGFINIGLGASLNSLQPEGT